MIDKLPVVLVTGDWQVSDKNSFPSSEKRLARSLMAFRDIEQVAKQQAYDAHFVVGDFFDIVPSFDFLDRVMFWKKNQEINTTFLRGNHEVEDGGLKMLGYLPNCYYPREVTVTTLTTKTWLFGLPYFRKWKDFIYVLENDCFKRPGVKKAEQLIILCHQFFDTFHPFESSDTVKMAELEKCLSEFAQSSDVSPRFNVVSGHYHEANRYYNKELKFAFDHIGIPIDNTFAEAERPLTAISLEPGAQDDNDKWDVDLYRVVPISIARWYEEAGHGDIARFKIWQLGRMFPNEVELYTELLQAEPKHYYRLDVAPTVPFEHRERIATMVKHLPELNIQIKWQTEKLTKEELTSGKTVKFLSKTEVMERTVDELNTENLDKDKLIAEGKELISGDC